MVGEGVILLQNVTYFRNFASQMAILVGIKSRLPFFYV